MSAYSALAAFYDRLMRSVDYDAWAARYARLLAEAGVRRGAFVVDLGCGTGQITWRLGRAGYRMLGVDLSPQMLGQAQENARRHALPIPFVLQDMRKISLSRPADAMTCACDGINYIAPSHLSALFGRLNRSLRPGGALLFDVSTPWKLQALLGDRLMGDDLGDLCYLWQNRFHPEEGRLEMELTFFQKGADGRYTRFDERQTQWAHPAQRLLGLLAEAGFAARAFSGLSDGPIAEADERQLVFAIKKEEIPPCS